MSTDGSADIAGCADTEASTFKPGRACAERAFPTLKMNKGPEHGPEAADTVGGKEVSVFRRRIGSWDFIGYCKGRLDRRDLAISRTVSGASANARRRLVEAAQSFRGRADSARGSVDEGAGGLVLAGGRRGRLTSSGDETLFGRF